MLTPRRKDSNYHHGSLRESAILAARKQVEREGVSRLSLRKVADEIGVSPAALYRHFENLENLRAELSEVVRQELGQYISDRRDASVFNGSKTSALKRLNSLGSAYIEYAKKNPRIFEMAFLKCESSTFNEYDGKAWLVLQQTVKELVDAGVLNKAKSKTAPILIWSTVHGFASLVSSEALPIEDFDYLKANLLKDLA